MKKQVYIEIVSTQVGADGQKEILSSSVEGNFYEKDGKKYVLYEENDVVSIPSAYFIPRLKKPNVTIQCLQTGTTSRKRDFEITILYTKTTDTATA